MRWCWSTQNAYNNVGLIVVVNERTHIRREKERENANNNNSNSTSTNIQTKRIESPIQQQEKNTKYIFFISLYVYRSLGGWCANISVQVTQVDTCFSSLARALTRICLCFCAFRWRIRFFGMNNFSYFYLN